MCRLTKKFGKQAEMDINFSIRGFREKFQFNRKPFTDARLQKVGNAVAFPTFCGTILILRNGVAPNSK